MANDSYFQFDDDKKMKYKYSHQSILQIHGMSEYIVADLVLIPLPPFTKMI